MRIVHLITRLIIGGAQENTVLSCEGLAARGHEVSLLSGPTTGPEGSVVDRARRGPYRFIEVPELLRAIRPLHDLRALNRLTKLFEEIRPDVVHTHSSKAGILGRIAAHRAAVPVIVHTIHGMSFNRTQPWIVRKAYSLAEAHCADLSQAIVCVADEMTRQSLDAGVGRPEQYVTIRSGMEVDQFDPARHDRLEARRHWKLPPDAVIVGAVARLFVNKGYEQLIDIVQRTVAVELNLHFLWVGDGANRKQYEAELTRRGLRSHVTITGLLPPEQMPAAIAAMDILAHTSQWEGLPRAVVQALLMERPAISFAIDGAPEVVIPGRTGELIPLNKTDRFADALIALARDPPRRAAYGRAGRERCLTEFDHRQMVDQLIDLYARLLVSNPQSAIRIPQ